MATYVQGILPEATKCCIDPWGSYVQMYAYSDEQTLHNSVAGSDNEQLQHPANTVWDCTDASMRPQTLESSNPGIKIAQKALYSMVFGPQSLNI